MTRFLFIRTAADTVNLSAVPPLGVLYLSAAIKKHFTDQFDIQFLDTRFDGYQMIPLTDQEIESSIRQFHPDIIGFSTLTYELKQLRKLTAMAKSINPDVLTIAGGPHPTFAPKDVLEDENLDLAVLGEAEETIIEVLKRHEQRNWDDIDGVGYRQDGQIVIKPRQTTIDNLDTLPFPDWDLIDLKAYNSFRVHNMMGMQAAEIYAPIFTSRACPYRCTYCHRIFGKKFRPRSPENVLEEIKLLYEKHNVRELHIYDDVFNLDKKRAIAICKGIKEAGWDLKIAFPNAIRGDILDEEMLDWLILAGTYKIIFAVETASPRLQKLIKKNNDLDKLKRNIDLAVDKGLLVKAFFMLGFPTETREELQRTVDFAVKSRIHLASFFKVVPQPGTALYEQAIDTYKPSTIEYDRFGYFSGLSIYEEATGINLDRVQKRAYFRFWFRPLRVLRVIYLMPRRKYILKGILAFIQIYSTRFDKWLKKHNLLFGR